MRKRFLSLALLVVSFAALSFGQTLRTLVNQPPTGAGIGFLLTDGTAIFQGGAESDWWKLTPDINGSYLKGTWTQQASLPRGYVPDAFASSVLADGRLVIVGGEYNNGGFALTNQGAIYDPLANTWTSITPPSFWDFIGDSPSVVMPNGKYLVGNKLVKQMAQLDPATLTWTKVSSAGKSDFNAEEGWTLLPEGTVLTFDVKNAPNAEKYIPSMRKWINAGNTIVDLHTPHVGGCIPYGPGGQFCYAPTGRSRTRCFAS